jgi:hypothetical protein
LFFGIFIIWGTTAYDPAFAGSIFVVAIGTFISGMFSIYTPINKKDKKDK